MNLRYDSTRNQIVLAELPPLSTAEDRQQFESFLFVRARTMYEKNSAPRSAGVAYFSVRGACAMNCTYCSVQNKLPESLDLGYARRLLDEHRFQQVQLYGGDPLDNLNYLEKMFALLAEFKVKRVMLYTGARNLTRASAAMINDFAQGRELMKVQISLEPREFACRVDHSGRPIQDILEENDAVRLLDFSRIRGSFRTTIPTTGTVLGPSFASWINWLDNLIGSGTAASSYTFMVTYDTNCCTLPPILDLWEAESDLATSVSKQNWHKSLFGPILHKSASGRFTVSCGTLGDTSPGVGSNQLTYICHHNAVDDDRKFADPKAHDGIVLDWSKDMLNEECYSCVAKYVCGGVCHRREKGSRSAECLFYRRAVKSSRMVQYAKDSGYLAAKMLSVNAPTLVPQNALDRWKSAKTLASAEAAVSTTSLQP